MLVHRGGDLLGIAVVNNYPSGTTHYDSYIIIMQLVCNYYVISVISEKMPPVLALNPLTLATKLTTNYVHFLLCTPTDFTNPRPPRTSFISSVCAYYVDLISLLSR